MLTRRLLVACILVLGILAAFLGYRVQSARHAATLANSLLLQPRDNIQQFPAPKPVALEPIAPKPVVPEPIVPKQQKRGVPALPGIEGYDFPVVGPGFDFAVALALEETDPVWAPDMENRLREAIRSQPEFASTRVEMMCRTSGCGVLFIPSLADDVELLKASVRRFGSSARELGFRGISTIGMHPSDGRGYIFLSLANRPGYVTTRATLPPGLSLVPKRMSPEEAQSRGSSITTTIVRGGDEE